MAVSVELHCVEGEKTVNMLGFFKKHILVLA